MHKVTFLKFYNLEDMPRIKVTISPAISIEELQAALSGCAVVDRVGEWETPAVGQFLFQVNPIYIESGLTLEQCWMLVQDHLASKGLIDAPEHPAVLGELTLLPFLLEQANRAYTTATIGVWLLPSTRGGVAQQLSSLPYVIHVDDSPTTNKMFVTFRLEVEGAPEVEDAARHFKKFLSEMLPERVQIAS